MTERTPLGKVMDASWSSSDREVRRICTLVATRGKAHVSDRPGFCEFKRGSAVWRKLESLGCEIEKMENEKYRVTVEGARRCYRPDELARRHDGD